MDCRECALKLDALLHNELGEEEKEKVLAHLSECESCKREYEDALELKHSFDTLVEKSDKSLADSVVAKIRKENSPYKKTPFLVRHMGLAASLVFILVLAVYTGVSEVRKGHSDMNISEMGASVTDAGGVHFVADIKNSATLESDEDYEYAFAEGFLDDVASKQESATAKNDENHFYSADYVSGVPLVPEDSIKAEEAPAPEPEATMPETEAVTETLRAPDALKGECPNKTDTVKIFIENLDTCLPLLSDFEIIEIGENYITVNAADYEAILKIIEEIK